MDTPTIERYKTFTMKTYQAFWEYYNNDTNQTNDENKISD